jgi:hypothetical protein
MYSNSDNREFDQFERFREAITNMEAQLSALYEEKIEVANAHEHEVLALKEELQELKANLTHGSAGEDEIIELKKIITELDEQIQSFNKEKSCLPPNHTVSSVVDALYSMEQQLVDLYDTKLKETSPIEGGTLRVLKQNMELTQKCVSLERMAANLKSELGNASEELGNLKSYFEKEVAKATNQYITEIQTLKNKLAVSDNSKRKIQSELEKELFETRAKLEESKLKFKELGAMIFENFFMDT